MFITKRPSGHYHLVYEAPNGKRTSVSTKGLMICEKQQTNSTYS
ncbi:MAG: hypothetical protein U5K00_03600 [Melioribacteraceae bacterium]|nr:hypothetical protein [Melioribacteraceae bacterium]